MGLKAGSLSGKKLSVLRQRIALGQKELVDQKPHLIKQKQKRFPCCDKRTLCRWEKEGIPLKDIQSVAEFFQLPVWVFLDDEISMQMTLDLFDHDHLITPLEQLLCQQKLNQWHQQLQAHGLPQPKRQAQSNTGLPKVRRLP